MENIHSKITIEELKKLADILNEMKPVATKIEVYPHGLKIIKRIAKENKSISTWDYNNIRVLVVEDADDFMFWQGKITYSDSSTQIIDIY